MRLISVDLFDFLDMVVTECLESNNIADSLDFAAKQIKFVTDEEIIEFASCSKDPKDQKLAKETLHRWRDKYCVNHERLAKVRAALNTGIE